MELLPQPPVRQHTCLTAVQRGQATCPSMHRRQTEALALHPTLPPPRCPTSTTPLGTAAVTTSTRHRRETDRARSRRWRAAKPGAPRGCGGPTPKRRPSLHKERRGRRRTQFPRCAARSRDRWGAGGRAPSHLYLSGSRAPRTPSHRRPRPSGHGEPPNSPLSRPKPRPTDGCACAPRRAQDPPSGPRRLRRRNPWPPRARAARAPERRPSDGAEVASHGAGTPGSLEKLTSAASGRPEVCLRRRELGPRGAWRGGGGPR